MSRQRWQRSCPPTAAMLLALLGPLVATGGKEPKLTAEELVARHLESLGPAPARAAVKSRVAQGTAHLIVLKGRYGNLRGPAAFATEGPKESLAIEFNHKQHPREAVAYDGHKVYAPRVVPEGRSRLGEFLFTYNQTLQEGLLGGTLSTAWPLLELAGRGPELKYAGVKTVEGRRLHRLDYRIRRGPGDLRISLYFELETYRHVRTSYRIVITPGMRTDPTAVGGPQLQYEFAEKFSDFRQVNGLTLPARWRIEYIIEGGGFQLDDSGTGIAWELEMNFDSIAHNQPIAPKVFVLEP